MQAFAAPAANSRSVDSPTRARLNGWAPELALMLAGLAATATIVLSPSLRLTVERAPLHATLEVVAGMAAALVALVFFGRFRQRRLRRDLLIAASMFALATGHLGFAAVPLVLLDVGAFPFRVWATLPVSLLGAFAFATAAFSGTRRAGLGEARWVVGAVVSALVIIGSFAAVLAPELPAPVDRAASGERDLPGHPSILVVQALIMCAYVAAAFHFVRRARREADGVLRLLGLAAVLAALARLNFVVYPTLFTDIVSAGDIFRLLGHVVLVTAAAHEITRYWHGLADDAVVAERRRIARDLHDGTAQELAFILRRVRRQAADGADPRAQELVDAAQRALEDSRRAIDALSRDPGEPLDVTLAAAARTAAARVGVPLVLRLDAEHRADISPDRCDALVRIACEAISNAGAHANPGHVAVSLDRRHGIRLAVSDDGCGFAPERAVRRGGFGLTSMRERAASIGGELRINSAAGRGTEVEVILP